MTAFSETKQMSEATLKDFYEYLIGLVQQSVATYLTQEKIQFDTEQLPIDLRFSAQSNFGDYSMPVMSWAGKKKLGRPPLQIAEAMATILRDIRTPAIQEITVTKPGYLNFLLNRPQVGKTIIERVIETGPDFGRDDVGIGTKVVVEHTAINSNKAAHVGHLRNSCTGDTVVRMLRSQGYAK